MESDLLIPSILDQGGKFLTKEDNDLVCEFLVHQELGTALEFICDKLIENNSKIPEELARMIQVVSSRLELNSCKTWEYLLVEEASAHLPKRLFRDGPDIESSIDEIFHEVKEKIDSENMEQIDEFIKQNEIDLAIDLLCYCLIKENIPIGKKTLDQIRTVLLDSNRDPNAWAGFSIKEE